MTDQPYTHEQLQALRKALARGERRVSFGDRLVEYRSVDELLAAIREIEAALAGTEGQPRRVRRLRVTTIKGF
ncbi:phage head-tail joining protein [Lysobacter sp. Hz 25]|uniref:phage head-tail joining protein n=1 Tax=Lysobacter sp. Hz 25 TaxID=3383698 RepID=UPI0038D4519D